MTSENIKEGSAEIPCDDSVFYNPIQEFNRDMSIAAISVWSEMYLNEIFSKKCTEEPPYQEFHPVELPPYSGNDSLQKKHREKLQIQLQALGERFSSSGLKVIDLKHERMSEYQFSIYEGLSASGLRSIRYAKELYNVSKIVANDYSEKAVKAITRNAEFNQVAHIVNAIQGDCSKTMYRYMCNQEKFHVIDLDPYGTAAPFLDAAIQTVKSGGLLCVTCTDMAVLAGPRPEACFAKYGSVNIPNAPFTHELALRILLNTIQSIASRYKKSIVPLLSCSIDYYVRVFVRVYDSAIDTKNCASKTSMVYYCPKCRSHEIQPIGKYFVSEKGPKYGPASVSVGGHCTTCDGTYQIGGPFYSAPIHNQDFVMRMIGHISQRHTKYGTWNRMAGMVQVISEEIDIPLYYVLAKLCNTVHCSSPKLPIIVSALLNAGYKVSQSHAIENSIKTNAPNHVIWDVIRNWAKKTEGDKTKKYSETTPSHIILSKEATLDYDFTSNPDAIPLSTQIRLIRFQENPTADWGPQSKPKKAKRNRIDHVARNDDFSNVPDTKKGKL